MSRFNEIYKEMGIDETVLEISDKIIENLSQRFQEIDKIAEYNQLKVIKALQRLILPPQQAMDIMI